MDVMFHILHSSMYQILFIVMYLNIIPSFIAPVQVLTALQTWFVGGMITSAKLVKWQPSVSNAVVVLKVS